MIHLSIVLIVLLCAINWGDFKKIKVYLPTMLYVGSMNLLYHVITDGYWLWKYNSNLLDVKALAILHSFFLLPSVAFLYLSNIPRTTKKALFYSFLWIIASFLFSFSAWKLGLLSFYNGYKIWMDIFFYLLMYSFIILHNKHPFFTYIASTLVIISFVIVFDVPW